jgi:hypothetical protein
MDQPVDSKTLWQRRFKNQVYANFRILHGLQFGLSLGMLGYMGVRSLLGQ